MTMSLNSHIVISTVIVLCLWVLICTSVFFLLNSFKIYKKLKYYEILFKSYKKQLLYNFVPAMVNCAEVNNTISSFLNVKAASKVDLIKTIILNLLNNLGFVQKLKLGIFLSKKILT